VLPSQLAGRKDLVQPVEVDVRPTGFEADLSDDAYGYRPERSAVQAVQQVHQELARGKTEVLDADLTQPPFQRPSVSGLREPRSPGTVTSPDSYRGVSTIPRAGLAPAGEGAPSRRTTNSRPDLTSGREEVRRAIAGSPAAMLIGLEPGASNH